jgi:iron complex outermembrane receptor protein
LLHILISGPELPETQQAMVVTANMIPTDFNTLGRNLTVITRKEILETGASSLQQLLQTAGVQIRERGAMGIQADVSLRGSSFEQVLILFDGAVLSDPQTGHHLLNLPVPLDQIERIEILRGPGSRIYGPNAFGGVINIIPVKKTSPGRLSLGSGENGYREESLFTGLTKGPASILLDLQQRNSDGYIENTDFDHRQFRLACHLDFQTQHYEISASEERKDFGAYHFYHPDYPNQREDTKLNFLKLHGDWITSRFQYKLNIHTRRHRDHFLLNDEHPEWYENLHHTRTVGVDAQMAGTNHLGEFALGMERHHESITSSNLGLHSREKYGFFAEQQFHKRHWHLQTGTSIYRFSEHGWEIWPGLDSAWTLNQHQSLALSVGRSFRMPTFTELYYQSKGHTGNPDLESEKAWNYELGYKFNKRETGVQASFFLRQSRDMIDWVWNTPQRVFHAENFSEMTTRGIELEIFKSFSRHPAGLRQIRSFYTWLDTDLNTRGVTTKYLLNHPEHALSITSMFRIKNSGSHSWIIRYETGANRTSRTFVDGNIQWVFRKLTLNLSVKNIGDHTEEDFLKVPLPGRWAILKMTFTLPH